MEEGLKSFDIINGWDSFISGDYVVYVSDGIDATEFLKLCLMKGIIWLGADITNLCFCDCFRVINGVLYVDSLSYYERKGISILTYKTTEQNRKKYN